MSQNGQTKLFQSTLPSQGATINVIPLDVDRIDFNPRSPHRERHFRSGKRRTQDLFQSTLPSQGATVHKGNPGTPEEFQSTLPSQGATGSTNFFLFVQRFQSTLPSQGATNRHNCVDKCCKFQSTLPSQGATANMHIKFLCDILFSTHSSKNFFTLSRFPQMIP